MQTPTSISIFRVEFPRVINGEAKSYSRRASKVTSTANSDRAAQKWFSFPGIIARDIRLYFKYYFFANYSPIGPSHTVTQMSPITKNVYIELNIFHEYLVKLLAPNVTSRIKYFTPCLICQLFRWSITVGFCFSDTQIRSTFLWILNSREACGRIKQFTHCYSLVFTQIKSNDIKMCNFISTRWNWQLKCLTE